ncbi:MAG: SIS domain-containing protein, partial [Armatimonadota bacterium]|nr:SIS domain-containing protein [Armatimonadota bacterium]
LRSAAVAMAAVFSIEGEIAKCVERYRYMSECMVTARGLNQATSQEAALKLGETCYVVANPLSAAEIMHGPIAIIEEGFPVFLYAPQCKGYNSMVELSEKLAEKKAEMIVISTDDKILERAKTPIKLPVNVSEVFSPLVYIVAGQLFAQYLSVTKGYNPDNPRGLSKVTQTM